MGYATVCAIGNPRYAEQMGLPATAQDKLEQADHLELQKWAFSGERFRWEYMYYAPRSPNEQRRGYICVFDGSRTWSFNPLTLVGMVQRGLSDNGLIFQRDLWRGTLRLEPPDTPLEAFWLARVFARGMAFYQGEEAVDGHRCAKIQVRYADGEVSTRWLAIDAGFLPLREEATWPNPTTMPGVALYRSVTRALGFAQTTGRAWVPQGYLTTILHTPAGSESAVVQRRVVMFLHDCSFDTDPPEHLFRLEFPVGASVGSLGKKIAVVGGDPRPFLDAIADHQYQALDRLASLLQEKAE